MKSLIFDVDGTLWDSTPDTAECWREVFSEQGIECSGITASRLKQEFGKLLSDIGRSLFPELPEKIMLPLVNECCRRNNDWLLQKKPPLYDGVRELFTFLFEKKLPIVIVSNCEAGYIEVLMKIHGLEPYVTGHLPWRHRFRQSRKHPARLQKMGSRRTRLRRRHTGRLPRFKSGRCPVCLCFLRLRLCSGVRLQHFFSRRTDHDHLITRKRAAGTFSVRYNN